MYFACFVDAKRRKHILLQTRSTPGASIDFHRLLVTFGWVHDDLTRSGSHYLHSVSGEGVKRGTAAFPGCSQVCGHIVICSDVMHGVETFTVDSRKGVFRAARVTIKYGVVSDGP